MKQRILKKRYIYGAGLLTLLLISSFMQLSHSKYGKLPEGKHLEKIKQSPNYRDGAFQNLSITPVMTDEDGFFKATMKFIFGRNKNVTPQDSIPSVKTDLKNLNPHDDVLIWLGHSSYFIQLDGKKIVVDPVLSGYASPFSWMINAFDGADIYKADDLPEIDYLLITHDHWDHLDYHTLLTIRSRVKQVICGLGVGSHLQHWGYRAEQITELDWYDHAPIDEAWKLVATPCRHFSGRGFKRNQTLWVSFVLQSPSLKLYIGGDSGYDDHYAAIGKQYGPFDLAILEQGQYDLRWKYIHLLPEQLYEAAEDLNASRILPVHNSKFALGNHDWEEPLQKLSNTTNGHQSQALTPIIGEVVYLNDSTQSFDKWWVDVE